MSVESRNHALWRAILSSFQEERTLRVHATLVADSLLCYSQRIGRSLEVRSRSRGSAAAAAGAACSRVFGQAQERRRAMEAVRPESSSVTLRYMSQAEHPLGPPLEMEPLPVQPSATGKHPMPRKLAQRDYAVGVCLLLLVVYLWTASNFVTEVRFDSDIGSASVRLTIRMLAH